MSKVVYVKIKPLETQACPCFREDLRFPGDRPSPARGPSPTSLLPGRKRRGGAGPAGTGKEGSLALGASSAFGSANGQLTRGSCRGPHGSRARSTFHWLRPPEPRPGALTPATVPRIRQPIGPPGLTSSPARGWPEFGASRPPSGVAFRFVVAGIQRQGGLGDKTDPELVSLAGEGCEPGHGGGSERQGSARRTADTSEPRTQSLRPPIRRRDEGTDLGRRLWDAIAATDAQHPKATGGLLQ